MSMRRAAVPPLSAAALLALALAALAPAAAAPARKPFQFSVAAQVLAGETDEAELRRAFEETVQKRAAFLLVTGIKSASEACSDKLYAQRRSLLDKSPRPLVLSLAGSDWTACRNSAGRSNAIERLNRIRELFFDQDESLGEKKLALNRLSNSSQFRSYAENAYWEYDNVLFATINLPAKNNHFLTEAGRNSEYEDRTVANRNWLQRLFALAKRKKLDGIVLVSDGDIGAHQEEGFSLLNGFSSKQDGFAQTRKQVRALADKFKGKVLLIDSAQKPAKSAAPQNGAASASAGAAASAPNVEAALQWRGNLAHLSLSPGWSAIRVTPGSPTLFTLTPAP
ncbi:hypothetical protein [Massilia sp. NR 4-1]|uniref:hypothetical protein n=1 Tax=Massilia sp. NR 4-1 TaxID=1678028 RepID=UPI00067A9383|nr:hypothetical protein [Massilia sp. NR 4-1]AKU24371.1 hypothetical protein ACZ75_25835 [Massilia sp. NR 4-1]